MDVSSFAEDNFDLKSWINNALSHGKAPEETMEQHASSLVMRLQLLSVEYNNSLEEISNQALLSVPRCVREVERAKREATELKKKLDFFVHNLSKVEKDSVESLKLLSQLDTIKMRIELCVNSLKEAQKLSIMNSPEQIESVFQSSNFSKIASELSILQHSLEVLKNVPEFRTHHKNLELLQDRLEQRVRGQLIQAFNNHDLDQAIQYVDIYQKINRNSLLMQHYYKCRQQPVEQFWTSFDRNNNLNQDNPFVTWLPSFYDEITIMVSKEATWASQLFSKDLHVIPTLVSELMTYISPLFKKRIEGFLINTPVRAPPGTTSITYVNQYPFLNPNPGTTNPPPAATSSPVQANHGLRYLINAYEITNSFATNLKSLLASTAGLHRIMHYLCSDSTWLDKIMVSIYDPYFPYQADFANLEKKWLQKELEKLKLVKRGYIETISQSDNSITKLFLVCAESLDHCTKLTHASEGDALLKVFSDILVEFLQHLFTILQYLRELANLDSSATPSAERGTASHSFFDWRFFQGALQLLQIVNKFTHRLNTFDRNIRTVLLQQKNTILPKNAFAMLTSSNPDFSHFPVLHIRSNPDKVKKLISFFHNLEDVAFKLLATPAQLLNAFASNTHSLVFDTIFHYIRDRFKTVPQLESWKQDIPSASNPLNLPSFSLAPLNYITQTGEHLLTLPQHLEPFSSHDSELYFDPKGIQNLNVIFEDLKEFNITMDTSFLDTSTAVIPETEDTIDNNNAESEDISENGTTQGNGNQDEEENKFASQWINAIGKGTMSLYLQKIMEIPLLKEQGAKQLATDIGYLMNVINALGIPVDVTLEIAFKYITMPKDEYDYRGTDGTENKIASMIAKMREIEK